MENPLRLSPEDVQELIGPRYAVGTIHSVAPIEGGRSACYRITSDTGKYVLKVFPPKYSAADLRVEPAVTEFLFKREYPVARLVPTTAGEWVWEHAGRAHHLQQFVQGEVHAQNRAPDWLVRESAVLLGRLHKELAGFAPMKRGFHENWFRWDPAKKRHEYEELLEQAQELSSSVNHDRIRTDLEYKSAAVERAARIAIDPSRLTRRNSHGDYHVSQLLCGPQSVRAVIDFSGACALPILWEVVRSYSLADPGCLEGKLDVRRLKEYIRLYVEAGGELQPYDLDTIADLYLLQLMRSTYGYREYLTGKGYFPDPSMRHSALLQFGFWRTDMCRWLEQHGTSLSRGLKSLAT
jgi:Ser/Thr protein kinase RdoA (MazF antagonist)